MVEIDLPEGDEPYEHAARTFAAWRRDGVLVRDDDPALWALTQDYTGPDGARRTRHGIFARVGVEDYGAGRIRPHERTHPGPKEDRLRLTRATRANLSPDLLPLRRPRGPGVGGGGGSVEVETPTARSSTPTAPGTACGGSATRRPSPPCRRASRPPSC